MTDPNPILIPPLQIDLLSVAFPLMLKDPYTGVGVLEEKCHVFSYRVSNNHDVESIEVHFRQKVVVGLESRACRDRLCLLGSCPAILFRIPMSLALLTFGVGGWVEAQMRPEKGRLQRTAGLDLVDPLEEAEVGRDSRPASDDPGATFRGAALDDGEE